MKKLFLNLFFLCLAIAGFSQPPFTEKTLTDMRQRMLTDWENYFKDEVSPDYVMQGHVGQTCDKTCIAELNKSATLLEWPMEQVKIRQVGNVAIVTGITHHVAVFKKSNTKIQNNQRFTDTYEYKNGKWLWLTAHFTDIQPPVDIAAQEAVIRNLENLEREAFLKNDTTTLLTQLWSPQMVIHAPANNISNIDNLKKRIAAGKLNYARFDRKIENIAFNDNLAIVMGEEKLEPQGISDNAGKTLTRRYTNIWKYTNSNWRMIARQATIIKVE